MTKIYNASEILTEFIEGKAVATLAVENGVHVTTIYRALHKYGVENMKVPGAHKGRNKLIYGEYVAGCPVNEIASRYSLAVPTIYSIIRHYKNSCI